MREYKFRGKPVNGENDVVNSEFCRDGFVYGSLIGNDVIVGGIIDFNDEYFNTEFWQKVDPATVGQAVTYYGKEFTTGDLISIPCHCDGEFGCSHGEGIYEFVYDANTAAYGLKYKGNGRFELLDNYDVDDMIIVGNRVDNPELLEG